MENRVMGLPLLLAAALVGSGLFAAPVESNFNETVRKLRLMTEFARERGKVVCISEAGGKHKRDDFWRWLYRAATADGVKVAFADTWSREFGTLPATPASEADEKAFAAQAQVLMEDTGEGFRNVPGTVGVIRSR